MNCVWFVGESGGVDRRQPTFNGPIKNPADRVRVAGFAARGLAAGPLSRRAHCVLLLLAYS